MNKTSVATLGIIAILIVGFYLFKTSDNTQNRDISSSDYKNAEYTIGGVKVLLKDGVGEIYVQGVASKNTVQYFGNEFETDLNDDSREYVVFILIKEADGTGVFYYAVAALNTENGYIGSDGYLLGDRIAPQNIELSQNPRHKNVVVINYADRAPGEPMVTDPSIGKSVYLKLDPASMQWGIVVSDFEGEVGDTGTDFVKSGITGQALLGPVCPVVSYPSDERCNDQPYETTLVVTTADGAKEIKRFTTDVEGKFIVDLPAGEYAIRSAVAANILPYCSSNDFFTVKSGSYTEVPVSCDTGIR